MSDSVLAKLVVATIVLIGLMISLQLERHKPTDGITNSPTDVSAGRK